ncbi:hypothetical protein [Lactobacillus delbrueckii]|uniref:hypothetical protein n=1 Tax=Lactobacillus delbrueckii TaxID=1584 RepID=UPI001786B9DC|nr:hypothetical protein [Lactobacillus delbrueckii]MBD5834739.1 hypothetical protein [Lactobacillus delbrueckii]
MTYLFAETYARNAIEGHRTDCKEIVDNYAHVYRKQPKAVLIAISVMLMDPTDYSYADYDKIERTIIEMIGHEQN